jgi:acyl transferase domain-containing protein/NADPH:quinone reductase-like Zn-dependent oxidoreductase/acyl carrier protein/SAM-dependent methyltransferase
MTTGRSPIAIVGMSLRLPGGIASAEDLWVALNEARDLVTEIGNDRWPVGLLAHPRRSEPGRSVTFSAGVIDRIGAFDAQFFGISPREAELMDPQQRLLLELAWEACEDAGIPPSSLAGSNCAVYLGISGLDHGVRLVDDLATLTAHTMTGNTMSVAANRISYVLDLHGPSVAVDTACSSSLVALHHACLALRTGEATAALVAGVNLLLHPYPFIGFTKASMLSAGGRCRPFAEGGDGYVRAEGGGMFLLKPLAAAQRDGDRILGVIRATGVNTDGARKSGLTIPSGAAQEALMRRVLAESGLAADAIDYLEAHGTGTRVGDPIEAGAIGRVYGQDRAEALPIGSVKSNLGHMEAAAGIAGLAKALLVARHGVVPATLHAEHLNEAIDFNGLGIDVVRRRRVLARSRTRRVAVNSFGFGGVNSHAILEVAEAAAIAAIAPATLPQPLVLSAQDPAALRELAGRYAEALAAAPAAGGIAHAAWSRREWLRERLGIADINDPAGRAALHAFAAGEAPRSVLRERALPAPARVAFIFSGNGAQWTGMGRSLLRDWPEFARDMAELAAMITRLGGPDVLAALAADDKAVLQDTAVAQPALFALQVAATQRLRGLGLSAAGMMGHSVGEIAAAWAAGALDLEAACRVVIARSTAQALTRGSGRMAAAAISVSAMRARLMEFGLDSHIEIAAENSPGNVTVTGELEALEALGETMDGVFYRILDLDYGFHSHRMDPIRDRLLADLQTLRTAKASAGFYSSVTGGVLEAACLGAEYWWRNVREPVRFGPAMAALAADGFNIFIEIGPQAILQRYITETLQSAEAEGVAIATARHRDDTPAALRAAGLRATLCGAATDASAYFPLAKAPHAPLPRYPWQRQDFRIAGTTERFGLFDRLAVHPLLGYRLRDLAAGWEAQLDPATLPLLAEHRVGGAAVLPGAAYLEMALAAARAWHGEGSQIVEELDILAPVAFDVEHGRTLRFSFSPTDLRFRIEGRLRLSDAPWTLHAQGRLLGPATNPPVAAIPAPGPGAARIEAAEHYALAASLGLDYGPAFRGVQQILLDGPVLRASIAWPDSAAPQADFLLHPAVVDQCFQSVLGWLGRHGEGATREMAFLPVGLGRVTWLGGTAPASEIRARLLRLGPRSAAAEFELFDAEGTLVARLENARFRAAPLNHGPTLPTLWASRSHLAPLPDDLPPLPALRPIAEAVRTAPPNPETLAAARYFAETAALVEMLPVAYLRDAIASAGPAGLAAWRSGHPFQRWLARLAADEGLAELADGSTALPDDMPPTPAIWAAAIADCPILAPDLLQIGRIGRYLTGDPLGDPAQIAAAIGPAPDAGRSPLHAAANQAIFETVAALCASWQHARPLRILDIGASEETMLVRLRPVLPARDLYYVIARADAELRARLEHDHAGGEARVIGLEPADFSLTHSPDTPAAFDIVLVHHALHLAPRPALALRELRGRLAANGVLILAGRYPDRASDFIRGSEASWWHAGAQGPQGGLMPPPDWLAMLDDMGWTELCLLPDPAGAALGLGSFVILARPAPRAKALPAAPEAARWAIPTPQDTAWSGLAEALAEALRAAGQTVLREAMPQPCGHYVLFPTAPDAQAEAAVLAQDCDRLRQALLGIARHTPQARVWLVTRGSTLHGETGLNAPTQGGAAISAMRRTAANELHPLQLSLIDLPEPDAALAPRLLRELLENADEAEIVLTPEARHVLRLEPVDATKLAAPTAAPEGWRLDFSLPGQLRNLFWRQAPRPELRPDEVEIEACAAGLNFRDVMYAMGLLGDEALEGGFAGTTLGLEVAGRIRRCGSAVRGLAIGDDVLAFAGGSFASHVTVPAHAVAPMPPRWTYAEAATVPTVFFTCWYALTHLARLERGERILIHGAAGGVGLAAIQIARHLGAEIFASAGSPAKRDLASLLGADHVLDSRDPHFDQAVLDLTQGEGVDVVLNSLAGEAIQRNLRALRPFGRFIELGKRDLYENTAIGLRPFRNNISYFGVDADQLMQLRPEHSARIFGEVMQLFAAGTLTPLPHRVFAADEVVEAFRHMQQARQIGKIVIDLVTPPCDIRAAAPAQRVALDPGATYLVAGGLSGFGHACALWLAERGARHIVLLSRQGPDAPEAAQRLAALRALGAEAVALAVDITDRDALAGALQTIAATMPGLRGVVHAAMVLDDALLGNLDATRFARVLAPKLDGARHLDALTRALPLDLFVLFSSATVLLGNPGQANYVAANAAIEALALQRRRAGLPGCAVAWGPVGDTGVLTGNAAARDALQARLGAPPMRATDALARLDLILASGETGLAVMDLDWPVLARALPDAAARRFDELRRRFGRGGELPGAEDLRARLRTLPKADARAELIGILAAEIAVILRLPAERISPTQSVLELGMDSLMAVELSLALEKRFGVSVPPMLINENPGIDRIADRVLTSLGDDAEETDATVQLVHAMAARHAETEQGIELDALVERVREATAGGQALST